MARTISGGERSLLAGKFALHLRVEVQNDDLTWIDLSDLEGINFVDGAQFGEEIDIPIAGATVQLRKTVDNVSLAPLVEGSAANVDDSDEYAPLLNGGREIRISTACTVPGDTPATGDWKLMFHGKIDTVDWGPNVIALSCRDLGARMADTFIEDEVAVAEPEDPIDEGVPLETLMQTILDMNNVPGSPVISVPASPAFIIRPYRQSQMSVFDALRTLALQRGWDFRYRFGSGDTYAPTLYDPNRDNTTPAFTIGPSEYLDVAALSLGDADIRNRIRITYLDRLSGNVEEHDKEDADSIAVYGPRFMEVQEASTSQIDSADEADRMADAILDDLATPYATHEIRLPYFWPVQLHDVIALPANFVHYDNPQSMAVVAVSHALSGGRGITTIRGRAKPAGAFMDWLHRAGLGRRGEDLDSRIPVLLNFRVKQRTATTQTYAWTRGRLTKEVWVGQETFTEAQLGTLDCWEVVKLVAANTPPLAADENELTVLVPPEGHVLLLQVEPRGVDLFAGEVQRAIIHGTPAPFEYEAIATEDDEAGTAKLQVTVDDPRGVVETVRFWKTIKNVRTGPHAATSSANPVWAYSFVQQAKHATLIQMEFVRNDGEPNFWSDVFSFDRDNDAEIQQVLVSYAGQTATVIVDGDTDTDTLWAAEVVDDVVGTEFELDYRGDGTDHRFGVFEVEASPDDKRLFRVYAKNADGDAGVYREVEINQFFIATRFVQVVARMTAVTADEWEVTVDVISPVAGEKLVELVSITGDSTVIDGPAIGDPQPAPQTWTFSRTAGLGIPSWALFEGSQTGLESDQDSIIIPEQGQDTIPLLLRVIPLVSTDPTKQNVRVLVADPQPIGDGRDYVSIAYESEGTGAITHTESLAPQAGGQTDNPHALGFVSDSTDPDFFDFGGQTYFNYIDFEIVRPSHGSDPGRVSFTAAADERAPDSDAITVLPVDRLQLQVDIEQISESPDDVEVQVTVTDPKPEAGTYITLTPTKTANIGTITPSGSGALASGGTRSFLIPLPAFRAGKGQVIFTASATDRVDGSNFVDIPEMAPDPAGNLNLTIDDAGNLDANVQGDSEIKSWKWLASDTAMPDDEDVIDTGTLVNAQSFTVDDAVFVPNPGTGYFKAVPFYFTGAVGDPGVPLSGHRDRADTIAAPVLVFADPDNDGDPRIQISGDSRTAYLKYAVADDGFPSLATVQGTSPIVASHFEDILDLDMPLGSTYFATALAYTAEDEESPPARATVTRQNSFEHKKTVRSASSFKPQDLLGTDIKTDGSYHSVGEDSGKTHGYAFAEIALAPGCVITGWEMLSACSASGTQKAELKLFRTDGAGSLTLIATLTNSGSSGLFIVTDDIDALDEEAGDRAYYVRLELDWTNAGGVPTKFAEMTLYYDAPTFATTV